MPFVKIPFYLLDRPGQASQAVSSWDLPSQTTLKFRKRGQNSEAELRKRDVRAEVEESERRALDEKPAIIDRRYGERLGLSYTLCRRGDQAQTARVVPLCSRLCFTCIIPGT